MNYCYKVKHKFLKKRPDGSRDIEEYFSKFVNGETGIEIYSIKYLLPPESKLVQSDISIFNDPKWQKASKLEEHLEDFKNEGVNFNKNEDGSYTIIQDDALLKDLGSIRICVDMDEDDNTLGYIFILKGDEQTLYFNSKILDENIPDIINTLLNENVIYKVLSPEDKIKRKNKKSDA